MISIFVNLLSLVFWLAMWFFFSRMFHPLLKRKCYSSASVLNALLLGLFGLGYSLTLLWSVHCLKREYKSLYLTLFVSISLFISIYICFMYFGTLILFANIFIIVISSCWSNHFIFNNYFPCDFFELLI